MESENLSRDNNTILKQNIEQIWPVGKRSFLWWRKQTAVYWKREYPISFFTLINLINQTLMFFGSLKKNHTSGLLQFDFSFSTLSLLFFQRFTRIRHCLTKKVRNSCTLWLSSNLHQLKLRSLACPPLLDVSVKDSEKTLNLFAVCLPGFTYSWLVIH
jgi:hypothetical protein